MLVGSGGVVALVLGLWSGVWAIRRLPRTTSRGWWPIAVAWVAAIVGFSLLSSFEEPVLGLFDLLRRDPATRAAGWSAVTGWWMRPLAAALIGVLLLASGVVVGGSSAAEPVDPARIREPLPADRPEVVLSGVAALIALVGGGLLVWLVQQLGALEPTAASLLRAAEGLTTTSRYGVVASLALIGDGVALGAWRGWRSWRARAS